MPHSLVKNHIHIVFSTKNRVASIDNHTAPRLYSYMNGICNNHGCYPELIGGFNDHVHILCQLSKSTTLSRLVQELKTGSSKWIKIQNASLANFKWQNGYATFSVQYDNVELVKEYIANQHAHHNSITFKVELRKMLSDHGLFTDEKYLWD